METKWAEGMVYEIDSGNEEKQKEIQAAWDATSTDLITLARENCPDHEYFMVNNDQTIVCMNEEDLPSEEERRLERGQSTMRCFYNRLFKRQCPDRGDLGNLNNFVYRFFARGAFTWSHYGM